MTHSNREMERLCLDLAEDAGPDTARALREVAGNYREARDAEVKDAEAGDRPGVTRTILLVAALFYVIWTPLAFWLLGAYVPERVPRGKIVEQLGGFQEDGVPVRYTTRTYRLTRHPGYQRDPAPPMVYENTTPLPAGSYSFSPLGPNDVWRFVTITASDGSDPRRNGRRYYAVLPYEAGPTGAGAAR